MTVAYTGDQLAGFRAEFARRRRLVAVAFLLIALPLYGLLFSHRRGAILAINTRGWAAVCVAVAAGVAMLCSRIARCPACNGWLGRFRAIPACPKCGVPLR